MPNVVTAPQTDPLAAVIDEEERARRGEAIDRFSQYVDLLQEATAAALARYFFKLEFADGRWDLAEKELAATPHIGEFVEFAPGDRWRVHGSLLVRPRPPSKPVRELFVCAPVA